MCQSFNERSVKDYSIKRKWRRHEWSYDRKKQQEAGGRKHARQAVRTVFRPLSLKLY